jgi:hypothetical protein
MNDRLVRVASVNPDQEFIEAVRLRVERKQSLPSDQQNAGTSIRIGFKIDSMPIRQQVP